MGSRGEFQIVFAPFPPLCSWCVLTCAVQTKLGRRIAGLLPARPCAADAHCASQGHSGQGQKGRQFCCSPFCSSEGLVTIWCVGVGILRLSSLLCLTKGRGESAWLVCLLRAGESNFSPTPALPLCYCLNLTDSTFCGFVWAAENVGEDRQNALWGLLLQMGAGWRWTSDAN
jgi:hypothetical protein